MDGQKCGRAMTDFDGHCPSCKRLAEQAVPKPAPSELIELDLNEEAKPWERQGTRAGEEIVGPDGGKMVWVPAGGSMVGSPEGEGHGDEHPAHRVRITKGFWLGKCTVTNAQYQQYCQETGVEFPKNSDHGDNQPVVCVTWDEAQACCQHCGLSLPTEAQWEYAAWGSEGRKHPWGNQCDPQKCCNWANRGPGRKTFPVGGFPEGASWCGALDMAGNVWQWCNGWYDERHYANSPDADPPGPDTGGLMPMRGGSWLSGVLSCRSANPYSNVPVYRNHYLGFRCSRTPPDSAL